MARLTRFLALPLLLAPLPAAAQHLGGGGTLDVSLTRIVTALILCLMVAAFAVLLLKRSGGKIDLAAIRRTFVSLPTQRRIEIVETRRASQYADICLLRCDGREYLILCAPQQQTVLREQAVSEAAS